jgi:phosphatidylserine/phosphatidylglycerophosphate/cardiolipin synthase-like enzyme
MLPGTSYRTRGRFLDGKTVITGSFNFTRAAEESDAENLLVIQDGDLAAKYAKNWQSILSIRCRMSARRRKNNARGESSQSEAGLSDEPVCANHDDQFAICGIRASG